MLSKVSVHQVGSAGQPIRAGDEVLFKAPSGKKYEGVIIEVDFFCNEIQVKVWFETSNGKRVIESEGWWPLSKVEFLDEVVQ